MRQVGQQSSLPQDGKHPPNPIDRLARLWPLATRLCPQVELGWDRLLVMRPPYITGE